MFEKRTTAGNGKRPNAHKCQTIMRRADGSTWEFPRDNPNAIELAKALTRRGKRRAAARSGLSDNRTAEDIRERMARGLAARERNLGVSIQSDVELTHTAFSGGWTLAIQ